MLERPALTLELVHIVPAIGMKRVGDQRRAKRDADLLPRLPDLELVDLVLRDVVALVDVELVDAQAGEIRAAAERKGEAYCAEDHAHGCLRCCQKTIGNYIIGGHPLRSGPPAVYPAPMSTPHDLKNAGLKATLPRLRIINLFEQSKVRHLTAEDVYKQLLADGLDVGLATVYRVLTQFEQAGLLIRHHFESGKSVFELNQGGHHDHLVCLQCGRVEEFFDPEIEKRQLRIARDRGFEISEHALYLYAECVKPKCPYRKPDGQA